MTTIPNQSNPLAGLLASAAAGDAAAEFGDIAESNLLCASELPGSNSLDIDAALVRIDEMAHQVDAEIRRNYHRFVNGPI